jgi:hypothetical protein
MTKLFLLPAGRLLASATVAALDAILASSLARPSSASSLLYNKKFLL